MKREYTCGIYRIYCQINRECYVGSSYQIAKRWYQHRKGLRTNCHTSPYLQNAWNKYGEEAFTFKVLEECDRDILHEREQFWIDRLNPRFNSMRTIYPRKVRTPEQIMKAKAALTPEKRARINACNRANWALLSDEEKQRRAEVARISSITMWAARSDDERQEVQTKLSQAAKNRYTDRTCTRGHYVNSGPCTECRNLRVKAYEARTAAAGRLIGEQVSACKYGHDLQLEENRYINNNRVFCRICAKRRAEEQRQSKKRQDMTLLANPR